MRIGTSRDGTVLEDAATKGASSGNNAVDRLDAVAVGGSSSGGALSRLSRGLRAGTVVSIHGASLEGGGSAVPPEGAEGSSMVMECACFGAFGMR